MHHVQAEIPPRMISAITPVRGVNPISLSSGNETLSIGLPQQPFSDLGQRLIDLGAALQRESTTVRELQILARSCGIRLHLRSTPDVAGAEVRRG